MNLSLGLIYLVIIAFIIILVVKATGLILRVILVALLLAVVFGIFNFDIMGLKEVNDIKEQGLDKGEILLEADCKVKNGVWIESEHLCDYTYEDAGLSCYDKDQCKGLCMAEFVNDSYVGRCQSRSILPETYKVMENGVIKEVNKSEGLY
ncbi:MAG: hypothetical protein PHG05_04610 [Candidatus Nanoarchaeia archaeon]|nr:hypothetical protein [Candidatus Nanoarchaeia archaeon]